MTSILHLKTAFNARVIFDRYVEGSLKDNTRKIGATYVAAATAVYVVHDSTSISAISSKQLLSCTSPMHSLTCYLGQGLLERFDGRDLILVVVYDTFEETVNPRRPIETHSHEEADVLIPLLVILSIEECTYREVDVWSPDTVVIVLLMDLGALTKLTLLTGKGAKHREIDIGGRVKAVGWHKSGAVLGFHHFTGADWGRKFVGLSNKTRMTAFLFLGDNYPIVETISHLGEGPMTLSTDDVSEITPAVPASVKSLETFVCKVYAPKSSTRIQSELRWELFRAKHLQSEMLPPTVGTLIPHVQRVNYMVMRDKGYTSPHPSLPNIDGDGWSEKGQPIKCLVPPAPRAVVELVKCGCKGECKGNCFCAKNGLACTPLCKYYAAGCSNLIDYHRDMI